ncbi:MAG: outer membrane beta-barrel protein [Methylocella sp.]
MLRRTLLASAGAMALTGAAVAADLGARPPPPVFLPPPPIFSWTGLYLGVNAGGTWSNSNTVDTTAVPVFAAPTFETELALSSALATTSVPVSNSGFIGGGQIGYKYQFNNSFVAGVEADLQGIAGSTQTGKVFGSGVPVNFPAETITSAVGANKRVDYIGTVRGRLGFLVTPTLLAYGTGGLAYGGVDSNVAIFQQNLPAGTDFGAPFSSFGNLSNSRVGWTAGGGLEWLFYPNWSLKVEYLYYDLGSPTFGLSPLINAFTDTGGAVYSSAPFARPRFTGNIVRAGLNYHFNLLGPAPVVTKY